MVSNLGNDVFHEFVRWSCGKSSTIMTLLRNLVWWAFFNNGHFDLSSQEKHVKVITLKRTPFLFKSPSKSCQWVSVHYATAMEHLNWMQPSINLLVEVHLSFSCSDTSRCPLWKGPPGNIHIAAWFVLNCDESICRGKNLKRICTMSCLSSQKYNRDNINSFHISHMEVFVSKPSYVKKVWRAAVVRVAWWQAT